MVLFYLATKEVGILSSSNLICIVKNEHINNEQKEKHEKKSVNL